MKCMVAIAVTAILLAACSTDRTNVDANQLLPDTLTTQPDGELPDVDTSTSQPDASLATDAQAFQPDSKAPLLDTLQPDTQFCTPDQTFCYGNQIRRCIDDTVHMFEKDCSAQNFNDIRYTCKQCPAGPTCEADQILWSAVSKGAFEASFMYKGGCPLKYKATMKWIPGGFKHELIMGKKKMTIYTTELSKIKSGERFSLTWLKPELKVEIEEPGKLLCNNTATLVGTPPISGPAKVIYSTQTKGSMITIKAYGSITCDGGKTWTTLDYLGSGIAF